LDENVAAVAGGNRDTGGAVVLARMDFPVSFLGAIGGRGTDAGDLTGWEQNRVSGGV